MAVKKSRKGVITAPEPAAAEGANDLQLLHPNLVATLNGREVTVREYGFVEGLRLQPLLQPFLDDLYELIKADTLPPVDQIVGLIGRHKDAVLEALAVSADIELAELQALKSQYEGRTLLMKWWTANGPFFYRCVLDRILAERQVADLRAGATSTARSSEPATVTLSESAS
ncbi:DUF6631 family protein [Pseudomonas sp. HMWF032]|uniref:DUF6631 family protein n=1 Tax=Pseudomonas sp. HMWF032 TaxID=2056866 RepID=UPI0013048077|nr:DUF6631 family protein [Pseudomonas sp. HMWF032]